MTCPICGGLSPAVVSACAAVVEVHGPVSTRQRLAAVLYGLARRLWDAHPAKETGA